MAHYEIDPVKMRVAEMLGPASRSTARTRLPSWRRPSAPTTQRNYSASTPSGRIDRQSSTRIHRSPTASIADAPCASDTRRSARSIHTTRIRLTRPGASSFDTGLDNRQQWPISQFTKKRAAPSGLGAARFS